ncbi:hypothetical protein BpHYR1_012755 [Brachionus plicatilis]|uniref:Uncharacterized protein n=1 Tax=Brachionus plicatilis TaxID=10195 RepID=A0A3M7STL9_BRAPC|nr:hypothetical protein BpHYR1_012755 [Brachionus plicatilis]
MYNPSQLIDTQKFNWVLMSYLQPDNGTKNAENKLCSTLNMPMAKIRYFCSRCNSKIIIFLLNKIKYFHLCFFLINKYLLQIVHRSRSCSANTNVDELADMILKFSTYAFGVQIFSNPLANTLRVIKNFFTINHFKSCLFTLRSHFRSLALNLNNSRLTICVDRGCNIFSQHCFKEEEKNLDLLR